MADPEPNSPENLQPTLLEAYYVVEEPRSAAADLDGDTVKAFHENAHQEEPVDVAVVSAETENESNKPETVIGDDTPEVAAEKPETVVDDATLEIAPVKCVPVASDGSQEAATEKPDQVVAYAVSEVASSEPDNVAAEENSDDSEPQEPEVQEAAEENSDDSEPQEPEVQEAADPTPAVKVETAPADFRFPTTNQTRHCFTRYIEYHRCIAAKGEDATECNKFAKYYRALCPGEWIERWNEQRENGTFPGPL